MKNLLALVLALMMGGVLVAAAQEAAPEEMTMRGVITEIFQYTETGTITEFEIARDMDVMRVRIPDTGVDAPATAAQPCNQNLLTATASQLKPGDVVEVFGKMVDINRIEVCGDERYTITLLETGYRGTVVENIQGVAFDANNELIIATDRGEVRVLVMEGGLVPPEMAAEQCNQNPAANEVTWELEAGDRVEVFGRFVAEGEIEVCSDERYTITRFEEITLVGSVVDIFEGVNVDATNTMLLKTDAGEVWVLTLDGGLVPPEFIPQQCTQNRAPNAVMLELKTGDEVEVFGRVLSEIAIEVCSDERYSITPVVANE